MRRELMDRFRAKPAPASPAPLSPDAKAAVVEASYRSILRRAADPQGLQAHLLIPADTIEDFQRLVVESLSRSAEAAPLRYPGRALRSDADIVAFLEEGGRMQLVSQEALRAHLDDHWLAPPPIDDPPESDGYRQAQMALYQRLSGFAYTVDRERHPFDMDQALGAPYPYGTRSAPIVGDQLIAWGAVIRSMALTQGASVLEMGLGWGNLALQLAQMGHAVTGLDIEPRYIELVGRRARQIGVEIDFILGEFLSVETLDRRFDAVLFFESFHHCADHTRLLDALPRLLKPDGKLVLAGEAVDRRLPYPWGVNCSGHGVWAIGKHGWLELAFREDYLLDLLGRRGWRVSKHEAESSATATTYVCERD